jgi:hypothetical protein
MIGTLLRSLAIAAILPTAPQIVPGVYALPVGTAKALASMDVRPAAGDPLERKLDISLGDDTKTIRRYDIDMTKYLHLIIVSDDFRTFLHVHPVLHANGHFTIAQRFPRPTLYHIYADCEPAGIGQQVFRFDLDLGATPATGTARDLAPTGNVAVAGPYRIALSTTDVEVGTETHIRVHVTRNGKPARDLHPYLGALAHAVFLNGSDLRYAHVHPMAIGASMAGMDMGGMDMSAGSMQMSMPSLSDRDTSSPDMELHVAVRESGTYKLWFQFRGGNALHVASFVLTAR